MTTLAAVAALPAILRGPTGAGGLFFGSFVSGGLESCRSVAQ